MPLLVMPSDHVIADVAAFHAAIHAALPLVAAGLAGHLRHRARRARDRLWLDQGRRGDRRRASTASRASSRSRRATTAEAMLASGRPCLERRHLPVPRRRLLGALARMRPRCSPRRRRRWTKARARGHAHLPRRRAPSPPRPSNSIDYAVMEKAERVAVVPVAMGWSDVGSWDALHAISERDDDGNALQRRRGRDRHRATAWSAATATASRWSACRDLIVVAQRRRRADPAARAQPGGQGAARGDEVRSVAQISPSCFIAFCAAGSAAIRSR